MIRILLQVTFWVSEAWVLKLRFIFYKLKLKVSNIVRHLQLLLPKIINNCEAQQQQRRYPIPRDYMGLGSGTYNIPNGATVRETTVRDNPIPNMRDHEYSRQRPDNGQARNTFASRMNTPSNIIPPFRQPIQSNAITYNLTRDRTDSNGLPFQNGAINNEKYMHELKYFFVYYF